jgi:hypothetical protein
MICSPVWTVSAMMREIARGRATGGMRLASEDGQSLIFFEEGEIVYFVSDCAGDSLVEFLLRADRFAGAEDREQLIALVPHVTRSTSIVALLLARNVVDADALRQLVVEYAFECTGRMFERREITATFLANVRAPHPLPFAVAASTLLVEGVRRLRDLEIVRDLVGPLSCLAIPPDDYMSRLESAPLRYAEGAIGALVTEEIALSDLVSLSGLSEEEALRAVLALRLVGVLDPFVAPKQLSESGRLRRRLAAIETGHAVDLESAHIAFAIGVGSASNQAAIVETQDLPYEAPASEPPPVRPGATPPLEPPPVRPGATPTLVPRSTGAQKPRGASGRLQTIASVYTDMARAEADRGNYSSAVRYFQTALAQLPEDLATLMAFADLMTHRPGGEDLAEELLTKACRAHPASTEPRVALRDLLKSMGNDARAREIGAELERLDPQAGRKSSGRSLLDRVRTFAHRAEYTK